MKANSQMTPQKLKTVQETELELLKEFVNVCDKYQLTYFLIGGSLLGAVRHKGFIPWDDDLDVFMPWEDYQRFLELNDDEFSEGVFIANYKKDKKGTYALISRLSSNKLFIKKKMLDSSIKTSVSIDIGPLMMVIDDKKKLALAMRKLKIRKKFVDIAKYNYLYDHDMFTAITPKIRLLSFVPFRRILQIERQIDKFYESLLKIRSDETRYLYGVSSIIGMTRVCPRKWFEKPVNMDFEDMTVSVPNGWDGYLSSIYGDYMKMPPIDKRMTHLIDIY